MTEHTSDMCPVHPDAIVAVDLGDGQPIVERAGDLAWGPGVGPGCEGRIRRYRVVQAPPVTLH